MRKITFTAVACLMPALCAAQATQIDRAEITGWGVLSNKDSAPIGIGSGGILFLSSSEAHVETTTDAIPACIGTRFGIVFKLVGQPAGSGVVVTMNTLFPEAGLVRPGAATPVHENGYAASFRIGTLGSYWYQFDHPWELVPGTWTLELWSGNRRLAAHAFTIIPPQKHYCSTSPMS